MLRYCCWCVIFRWKSTSSVIIHYNLTEPGYCSCLFSSFHWHLRKLHICVCGMFSSLIWQFLCWKKSQQCVWSDEWCLWKIINPVKNSVFSQWWQTSAENNIKVKDAEESFCGIVQRWGLLSLHKPLRPVRKLIVETAELWIACIIIKVLWMVPDLTQHYLL